ncbi:MAG: HD domain-containing protein [Firmicutes bacterium]|nr:HD domain-containing protein [Bacillota bacterium]
MTKKQTKKEGMNWRSQPLSAVAFCILGAIINIAGSSTAVRFKLPLFLDSIGTILVAAFGGYLPGIAVGYITNIITGFSDITNAYYAVINVLIALLAALFEQKGFFKSPLKTIAAILCFALVGGGLGSLITYYLYGFNIGEGISAPFAVYIYENVLHNVFWAQLSADLAIDVIDKAVTVTLVIVIMRFIPSRLRPLIHFYGWRQQPLSELERKAAGVQRTRGLSLRHKILMVISVAIILIAASTVAMSFVLYHRAVIDENTATCQSVATLAAATIDGDMVDTYLEKGERTTGYDTTKMRLSVIKDTSYNIQYLYVYKIDPDGCHVVFDLDNVSEDGVVDEASKLGDVVAFDPSFEKYLPKLFKGETIPPVMSNDAYGWLLTVYCPVYRSDGTCACYAAADISMNTVTKNEISYLVKFISLFFAFFILVLAIGLWLAEYHIILPINTMSIAAEDFAFNSEKERNKSVDKFKRLNIYTGDEIERLYSSFTKTIDETDGYIEDIRKKGRLISKMQNGLILVLADIVESRDKCTGDHIKKTAAYTRIIMEQLRHNEKYENVLTDSYIEDVVNSAPLHDIGKIKIPDGILNKPGKLTDEEFAIMKQHTTAGGEIIEGAIALVSEAGYLMEAKNLAAYHHEKWNGTGYPKGLKGEEIPLSARIMAVADVFDALVSRRSYKEPFSFEKSMAIIIEGSGSHFEPAIVEAFVAAKEEVRRIAETNMENETEL